MNYVIRNLLFYFLKGLLEKRKIGIALILYLVLLFFQWHNQKNVNSIYNVNILKSIIAHKSKTIPVTLLCGGRYSLPKDGYLTFDKNACQGS